MGGGKTNKQTNKHTLVRDETGVRGDSKQKTEAGTETHAAVFEGASRRGLSSSWSVCIKHHHDRIAKHDDHIAAGETGGATLQ